MNFPTFLLILMMIGYGLYKLYFGEWDFIMSFILYTVVVAMINIHRGDRE